MLLRLGIGWVEGDRSIVCDQILDLTAMSTVCLSFLLAPLSFYAREKERTKKKKKKVRKAKQAGPLM